MNIVSDRVKTIFRFDKDGKTFYNIGISKKNKDGSYLNGYIACKFPNNVNLSNQTKIKIKEAWVDFYIKDKKTIPIIFINKFDEVEQTDKDIPQNIKTDYDDLGIQLKDEELPF